MSKAEDMTVILPNHNLSENDRYIQCRDLRVRYKNILNRLPKKMRRKCKLQKFKIPVISKF